MPYRITIVVALLLGALANLANLVPASAATYEWSYVDTTGTDNASGILTTGVPAVGDSTQNPVGLTGGFLIDPLTFSGVYNGIAITLLSPGTCCADPANDNIIYPTSPQFLDIAGLAFADANGDQFNLFFDSMFANLYQILTTDGLFVSEGDFTIRLVNSPLPATIPLFAGGLGLLGVLALRKRRPKASAPGC
jgi:hypothetical protein